MKRRMAALLLALAMLLTLLSGCGEAEAPAAESGDTGAGTSDSASDDAAESSGLSEIPQEAREDIVSYLTDGAIAGDDTVLTVEGTEIGAEEFFFQLVYQYSYISYMYYSYGASLDLTAVANEETGETYGESLFDQAVEACTMNALLSNRAEEAGLSLSEEQQGELDALEETEEEILLYNATTVDGLRASYGRNYLANSYRDYLFDEGGSMAPTAETLASYVEENGIYTCRYILCRTDELEEDDTEGREAKLQLAQDLYDQLSEVSAEELEETFTSLQAEHSDDSNTERYTFDESVSLVSGFREALSELAPGELGLSEETDYGYFVLLRLDATEEESVREDYISNAFYSMIDEWMVEPDAQPSEALENLDVAAFFERMVQLQTFLSEQAAAEAAESADAATDETAGAAEDAAEETADAAEETADETADAAEETADETADAAEETADETAEDTEGETTEDTAE